MKNKMELKTISERPPTLDFLFGQLEENLISFDRFELSHFLFEYASRVLEIEGFEKGYSETEDFREFIMRNELKDIVAEMQNARKMYVSIQETAHDKERAYTTKFPLLLNLELSIKNYQKDPHTKYIGSIFQKSGFTRLNSESENCFA